jgi:thiol-disulfide isomerase/thioredoxin
MFERVIIAVEMVVLGAAAYRVLLAWQRRRVAHRAQTAAADRAELLIFTSLTCAPCKLQQLPIVDRLMLEWNARVTVQVIDVTEQPEIAEQYGVWSLPTTIVLRSDRSVVAINQGVTPDRKLREQFLKATED